MQPGDRNGMNDEDEVRELLDDLDELHEIDRKRRLEPRDSDAHERAAHEVDRRSRSLIERLSGSSNEQERQRDARSERRRA
jgi:hypothetical protein